jgi:hypothetical protein
MRVRNLETVRRYYRAFARRGGAPLDIAPDAATCMSTTILRKSSGMSSRAQLSRSSRAMSAVAPGALAGSAHSSLPPTRRGSCG